MHFERNAPEVPYGFCHCGCGRKTQIADRTETSRGRAKGEPRRFVQGHGAREATRLKQPWIVDENGCWIWQAALIWSGYAKYKSKGAHRAVYEDRVGAIPEGMQLDHTCRNRACVNPAHMEVVTPVENTRRRSTMKLTRADVVEIRALAGSMSQRRIAERFGVHPSAISRVVSGKRWAA